jgi:hypothetical protein
MVIAAEEIAVPAACERVCEVICQPSEVVSLINRGGTRRRQLTACGKDAQGTNRFQASVTFRVGDDAT